MAIERSAWVGTLSGRWNGPDCVVALEGIAGWSSDGGSSPFRGLTPRGNYWVKPLNNTQTPRVTINEFVLGRVGRLIGAPTCEVDAIEIGADLAGQSFCTARQLEVGIACGSRDVPNVNPRRGLEYRPDDDNRRRHAGVYAFYDWCWGADDQWLYEAVEQNRTHSHDHGHFLPGGPDWSIASLEACVDEPHPLAVDTAGLDVNAVEQYAGRLESVTGEEIRGMLGTVPTQWPVSQEELETLGWFLERRARPVGERLRLIAGSLKGGQTQ